MTLPRHHVGTVARRLGPALAVLALFATASLAAPGDPPSGSDAKGPHSRMERRQEWIHSRLERTEDRLEIKASQHDAWQAFAKSVEAFGMKPAGSRPGPDADAASIARFRADRAADMAQKLAQVADATAKLQSVLNDDQRKVFDEMAHRFMHRDGRFHHDGGESHHHEG